MTNTEYSYENLPPVLQENEVTVTGNGDATVTHANTINVQSGLLRVHGTTTVPTYVNAYGDATILAYGNVVVTASETARAYGYNNAYIIAKDNANAELFGGGIVITNDNSQAVLYDTASAICHGNSKTLLYGNATATAMDNAILSVRDAAHAILRGHAQAHVYDTSTTEAYDTTTIVTNSPFVQIEARNSSVVAFAEHIAPYVHQQGNYYVFENPEDESITGQVHLVDGARVDHADTETTHTPQDSDPSITETTSKRLTSQDADTQLDENTPPDQSNINSENTEPLHEEQQPRHAQTETSTSVADLLARARKAKPEFAVENDVTPEPIRATPHQTTSPAETKEETETKNLLDESLLSDSSAPSDFTVDLSDSDEYDERIVPSNSSAPNIEQETNTADQVGSAETNPAENPNTRDIKGQKVNLKPARVQGAKPGSEVEAPEGQTAIEQLNYQGWYVFTEPSGMQVGFQYTEENKSTPAQDEVNSPEKKITGGFDFDDEEEEDEFIPSIASIAK